MGGAVRRRVEGWMAWKGAGFFILTKKRSTKAGGAHTSKTDVDASDSSPSSLAAARLSQ